MPRLEESIGDLGRAVETTGAMAAAFSAIPEMTLDPDEPLRCGFGGGGFGTQYAIAGGCAVRIAHRFHLNGALSYAPSIDYNYGATPSVAGRLGFSFPLGKINKPYRAAQIKEEFAAYRSFVDQKIAMLQADISQRDEQINELREKIEQLSKRNPLTQSTDNAPAAEATDELITALRKRIQNLETQKQMSINSSKEQQRILDIQAKEIQAQREEIDEMKTQIQILIRNTPNNQTTLSSSQSKHLQ